MLGESRESVRTHDPMSGHLGVVARAHDIPHRARGERAAGHDAYETVGRDPARRNPLHDAADGARPRIHARIMPGALGIGVNVLIIGVAAFNLLLDFDLVERGVAARAPKYMEWHAAFALLVTLVWLYIEILRLLSRLLRR